MDTSIEPAAAPKAISASTGRAAVAPAAYSSHPFYPVRAEGSYLWDADGKEYLDFFAGLSVHNAGHRHPAIVAAIIEQAQRFAGSSRVWVFRLRQ